MNFLLIQDDHPVDFFESFEAAKTAASRIGKVASKFRIETYTAPPSSLAWEYDEKEKSWVSQQTAGH